MKQSRGFWIFTASMVALAGFQACTYSKMDETPDPASKVSPWRIPMLPSPIPEPEPSFEETTEEDENELPSVTAGAFCAHEGAMGMTSSGKLMMCIRKPGEKRARWRQP